MADNLEQCEICRRTIGNLETPWVADDQVVCAFCWATSRIVDPSKAVDETTTGETSGHPATASLLATAVTALAVAGVGWLAAHFTQASNFAPPTTIARQFVSRPAPLAPPRDPLHLPPPLPATKPAR